MHLMRPKKQKNAALFQEFGMNMITQCRRINPDEILKSFIVQGALWASTRWRCRSVAHERAEPQNVGIDPWEKRQNETAVMKKKQ